MTMTRAHRPSVRLLAAAGAASIGASAVAQYTPVSAMRRVATYYKLPPAWGGTELAESFETTAFTPWTATADVKGFATQTSSLTGSTISATLEVVADLVPLAEPAGTFESADSTLLANVLLDWPAIATISGSYTLHRYQVGTATVDLKVGPVGSPAYTFVAEAPSSPEEVVVGGPIGASFALKAGLHQLHFQAKASATAATSLIAGTGDGTVQCELHFVPNEAAILDVPGEYRTIAAAIAAAADFEMVRVTPGVYHEHLSLGSKRLVIASASATEPVILDGQGTSGSLVTMSGNHGPETVLRGITFRNAGNGSVFPAVGSPAGGGVLIIAGAPRLIDCRFESNHATIGGGLHVHAGSATLLRCAFVGNSATLGGAVGFSPDSANDALVSVDGVLLCNTALPGTGGGIWAGGSASPQITWNGGAICHNSLPQVSVPTAIIGASVEVCGCPGDLDGDSIVGASDLSLLLGAWATDEVAADLDCSGGVDAADLAGLLGAWGPGCAP